MTLFLKQVEFNMKFFTILIALREYLGCAAPEKGAVEPGDPQVRNNAASSCPGQFSGCREAAVDMRPWKRQKS